MSDTWNPKGMFSATSGRSDTIKYILRISHIYLTLEYLKNYSHCRIETALELLRSKKHCIIVILMNINDELITKRSFWFLIASSEVETIYLFCC